MDSGVLPQALAALGKMALGASVGFLQHWTVQLAPFLEGW